MPFSQSIAVFAHPGHELRCLSSLQKYQSRIAYLTDASASTRRGRSEQSCAGLGAIGLSHVGASLTQSDAVLYEKLLAQDRNWLSLLFEETCNILHETSPDLIITDAAEGYNPAHDLCHFLVCFAAQKTAKMARIVVTPLTDNPLDLAGSKPKECLIYSLTKARAAMACGCNVLLADYGKWGEMVRSDNWHALRELNFGLRAITYELDEMAIGDAIAAMDWGQGRKLAKLVAKHANLETMLDAFEREYTAILAQNFIPNANVTAEVSRFMHELAPLLYERDAYATKLYHEAKLRLGNEAQNAALLTQAMVHLRSGPDLNLVQRIAAQVLHLQPGHPIAQEILDEKS